MSTNQPRTLGGRYTFKAAGAPVGSLDDPWGERAETEVPVGVWHREPLPDPRDTVRHMDAAVEDLWRARHDAAATAVMEALPGVDEVSLGGDDVWMVRTGKGVQPATAPERGAIDHAIRQALPSQEGIEGLDWRDTVRSTWGVAEPEQEFLEWMEDGGSIRRGSYTPTTSDQVQAARDRARRVAANATTRQVEVLLDQMRDEEEVVLAWEDGAGTDVYVSETVACAKTGSGADLGATGLPGRYRFLDSPDLNRAWAMADRETVLRTLPSGRGQPSGFIRIKAGDWRAATGRDQIEGQTFLDF
ncbi:MAG: hypothetical protein E6640_01645 [Actinomyces urogenitalis]|uniref:hypothetical protein n=1 Tax=Actinomyces urogenitalis TaxID=103621 RepID=UPI0029117402|nr:hypothetical protein [Actinomyces urogenitalis]MDU6150914.1 hypothetical protein [Actinomyces urogenitalis]